MCSRLGRTGWLRTSRKAGWRRWLQRSRCGSACRRKRTHAGRRRGSGASSATRGLCAPTGTVAWRGCAHARRRGAVHSGGGGWSNGLQGTAIEDLTSPATRVPARWTSTKPRITHGAARGYLLTARQKQINRRAARRSWFVEQTIGILKQRSGGRRRRLETPPREARADVSERPLLGPNASAPRGRWPEAAVYVAFASFYPPARDVTSPGDRCA